MLAEGFAAVAVGLGFLLQGLLIASTTLGVALEELPRLLVPLANLSRVSRQLGRSQRRLGRGDGFGESSQVQVLRLHRRDDDQVLVGILFIVADPLDL